MCGQLSKSGIKVNNGKIKLKMDQPAIVKADCLNNQAGINPEAKS